MHKSCTRPCLISEAYNTSTWTFILLQWIWGTQNTNNLHLDSCSFSPFVEIGLRFIRRAFSPLLWLHIAPSQVSVLHLTFGEPWWSSEMIWTSPPGWSSSSCPLNSSLCWSSPSRSSCHLRPLMYLIIPHINVLHPLVIPVIIRKMNSTLIVVMNPNWILYYTKSLD